MSGLTGYGDIFALFEHESLLIAILEDGLPLVCRLNFFVSKCVTRLGNDIGSLTEDVEILFDSQFAKQGQVTLVVARVSRPGF